jgi:putative phosphoesterase
MSNKKAKGGITRDLKGEWFKIGSDFYQQTWEQGINGRDRHFQGGPAPYKVFLKNGRKISVDAFKEAKAIHTAMQSQDAADKTGVPAADAIPAAAEQGPGQPQPQPTPLGLRPETRELTVAVLSDTHGVLPDVALKAMQDAGVQHIIHAGDIGSAEVIKALASIAPLTAILGEGDTSNYGYPFTAVGKLVLAGKKVLILHKPEDVDAEIKAQVAKGEQADLPQICVCGHTHVPGTRMGTVDRPDGSVFAQMALCNPGSVSQPYGGSKPGFYLMQLHDSNSVDFKRIEWEL